MPEDNPSAINVEEIVKQIEKKINSQFKKMQEEIDNTNIAIQKLAELGKQQAEQLAGVIGNVNDLGKRMDEPPKRISTAAVEQTGKGFETLLED